MGGCLTRQRGGPESASYPEMEDDGGRAGTPQTHTLSLDVSGRRSGPCNVGGGEAHWSKSPAMVEDQNVQYTLLCIM